MSPRQLAPHVQAAIAAVQRKAAETDSGSDERPRPGTAPPSHRPAPHVQAAIQARPAAGATAQPASHVQAALHRTGSPASVPVPGQPAAFPESTVQRSQQPEHNKPRRSTRKRKRETPSDPYTFLDDPNYGRNLQYEQQRAEFDKQQHKRREKFKKKVKGNKLRKLRHYSSNKEVKLPVLETETFMGEFDLLKGNTQQKNYALGITVGGTTQYFKTSYNKDVGLAPLYLDWKDRFRATGNRPFTDIAEDLDAFIGSDSSLRLQVGRMIQQARDNGTANWGQSKPKKKQRFTLESAIAELAIIFRLDLARAGLYALKATGHQNALLGDSKLSFQDMLTSHYIGIKASRLRNPSEYKKTRYR